MECTIFTFAYGMLYIGDECCVCVEVGRLLILRKENFIEEKRRSYIVFRQLVCLIDRTEKMYGRKDTIIFESDKSL